MSLSLPQHDHCSAICKCLQHVHRRLAWQYFALSLAGIGFIVLVMLVHPLTALLLAIAVGMVILFLFGELWVLGIRFNQVQILLMSMRSCCPYSRTFGRCIMKAKACGQQTEMLVEISKVMTS